MFKTLPSTRLRFGTAARSACPETAVRASAGRPAHLAARLRGATPAALPN
ncbi:hypothetical protein [Aminobacter sp. HY435]|nr:hypothetical protein [Aminobacter sp. HY435]